MTSRDCGPQVKLTKAHANKWSMDGTCARLALLLLFLLLLQGQSCVLHLDGQACLHGLCMCDQVSNVCHPADGARRGTGGAGLQARVRAGEQTD